MFWRFIEAVLVGIGAIVVLLCAALACVSLNNALQPKRYDDNYTFISYKDDNVLFYNSDDRNYDKPPVGTSGYGVGDVTSKSESERVVWDILEDLEGVCSEKEKSAAISKVTYGKVPECYLEYVKPEELIIGRVYNVSRSAAPKGNKVSVYFKLVKCKNDPGKICLETNSPAPPDIERKHRDMIRRLKERKTRF